MIGEEESVRIFDKQIAIQEIKHPTAQNLPKRFAPPTSGARPRPRVPEVVAFGSRKDRDEDT